MNPKIKLIIFDGYGVVLSRGYPDTCAVLSKKYKIPAKKLYKVLYTKYFNQAAERKISQKQAWQLAIKELKLSIDWKKLQKFHLDLLKTRQNVLSIVKKLKKDYKVIMLSKNTRTQFFETKKRHPQVFKIFDAAINTWELGLPKASKKTIRLIADRFKVKPSEILYIDDQKINLVEAKKMGVKTIFYQSFNQFKRKLNYYLYIF